jgi:hypothetical protein
VLLRIVADVLIATLCVCRTQICLQVPDACTVELEVTYTVSGASWASSYDVRAFSAKPDTVGCVCYGELRLASRTHFVCTVVN